MRYAVISDIHSNLEALSAFLEKIEKLNIDKVVCLGDLVGYNANPNECLDLVKEHGFLCVMGNHDSRVAGLEEPTDFNYHAEAAVYWTRGVLTDENREFLKSLPRALLVDNRFLAVHGWITDTDRYILGANDARRNFQLLKESYSVNLCFFGHTHVAISYIESDHSVLMNADKTLEVKKNFSYLVNPGGLGQPRDRDPRAPFVVYDSKDAGITHYRIDYDINATADKIIKAGLPERLAERLKLGW